MNIYNVSTTILKCFACINFLSPHSPRMESTIIIPMLQRRNREPEISALSFCSFPPPSAQHCSSSLFYSSSSLTTPAASCLSLSLSQNTHHPFVLASWQLVCPALWWLSGGCVPFPNNLSCSLIDND
jgi:hypothetical protein